MLRAGERAAFLAEAAQALSGSLNLGRTLARALHLVVPRFGLWAQVAVADPTGTRYLALPPGARGVDSLVDRTVTGRSLPPARGTGTGAAITAVPDPAALAGLAPDPQLSAGAARLLPGVAYTVALVARGSAFGELTVLRPDAHPPLDEAELSLLEDLAKRIALAVDAARLYGERTRVALVLQSSLRPPTLPQVPGVRLAARYRAASQDSDIGGDFYDVHGSGGDWSLVVGDVCGKGVEAAVLTGQARQAVRTAAVVDRRPAAVLSLLNTVLHEADPDGSSFATVACGRLRPLPAGSGPAGSVRLDLASAGHPAPLVVRAGGEVVAAPVEGLVVGLFPDLAYDEAQIHLAPGDACLFFTDGVLEARGPGGEFGLDRLQALAATCAGGHPEVLVDVVAQAVLEHLRGRAHDDIALLALTVGS